jgi:hypothetical protein
MEMSDGARRGGAGCEGERERERPRSDMVGESGGMES